MIKIKFKYTLLLVLYAIINTFFNLGIVYIINIAITNEKFFSQGFLIISFFSFIIYSYLLNLFFQKRVIDLTYNFVYDNELLLAKKLLQIPLKQLEKLGTERIYGIIEDMRVFVFLPGIISTTLNSILMILLCISYLFTVSFSGALVTVSLIVFIAYIYFIVSKSLSKKLSMLRNYNDGFNKFIHDILQGFKELKISEIRRNNLIENFISSNRKEAKTLDKFLVNRFNAVNILSQYGLYVVFGFIIFLLPLFGFIQHKEIASFIVVLLFMSGPINRLIAMQNMYTRIHVALKRVKSFFKEISINRIKEKEKSSQAIQFKRIQFKDCQFEHNNSFVLGPLNLSIYKGETIFIIGGNGSGKSTFINLLTGLYKPSSGGILLNEDIVQNDNYQYQNLLSAIFTDNYIFSHNYDDYSLKNNQYYAELLKLMKLDFIINNDEESSARRKLSKGQSKRMAMIFSLLENNPILVLDEWAADQDPYFRKYFYESLLPMLKKEKKTIIAVTHDDAYFHYADRILKFEYGRIVKDINTKSEAFNPSLIWSN